MGMKNKDLEPENKGRVSTVLWGEALITLENETQNKELFLVFSRHFFTCAAKHVAN
jgi:hypothetical protein